MIIRKIRTLLNNPENKNLGISDFLSDALNEHSILALTDEQGVILDINSKFSEISGYSREELIGKTHKIINSGFHSKDFWVHFWEAINANKIFRGEMKNKAKSGHLYWVDTTVIPFVDPDTSEKYFFSIRTDITIRKELYDKELQNQKRFSEIGKMWSIHFHEIGNLLGISSLCIEQLNKECFSMAAEENLRRLKNAIERGTVLLSAIKKISASALPEDEIVAPCNISSFFDLIKGLYPQALKAQGVYFEIQNPRKELNGLCIESAVVQTLINLINNSIYSTSMQEKPWLKIIASEDESSVYISVIDSGTGVPEQVRVRLFTEFFTTKKDGQGTGIGLSYSRGALKKFGGDLHYDAQALNTTFRIQLRKAV